MDIKVYLLLFLASESIHSKELGIDKRVIKGERTNVMRFPHAVALEVFFGTKVMKLNVGVWKLTCGGSIIDPRWIITAKYCVENNVKPKRIVHGTSYVSVVWESNSHLKSVKNQFDHPSADISLLLLEEIIALSPVKQDVIDLSTYSNKDIDKLSKVRVVGWGQFTKKLPLRTLWLHFAVMEFCKKQTTNEYCVIGLEPGSGACIGDTGSGLIVDADGMRYLHGIVSGRQDCNGGNGGPLISSHLDWIKGIMNKN